MFLPDVLRNPRCPEDKVKKLGNIKKNRYHRKKIIAVVIHPLYSQASVLLSSPVKYLRCVGQSRFSSPVRRRLSCSHVSPLSSDEPIGPGTPRVNVGNALRLSSSLIHAAEFTISTFRNPVSSLWPVMKIEKWLPATNEACWYCVKNHRYLEIIFLSWSRSSYKLQRICVFPTF